MRSGTILRHIALLLCLLILSAAAHPAAAHTELVNADPAPGAQLAESPTEIRLTFSEPAGAASQIVLLADGFLHELHVHMGFHPAWKYERVVELIFEAGILRRAIDQSQRMAEIRAQILASGDSSFTGKGLEHDAIQSFIDRAFDRRYRM